MSGYRSLHREQVLPSAIWSCQATPLLRKRRPQQPFDGDDDGWRIWTCSSDGVVRSYVASRPGSVLSSIESNNNNGDLILNASALQLRCSLTLTGPTLMESPIESTTASSLGCSVIHTIRNYTGEDTEAGDLVVASLELAGRVRIWNFSANWDEESTPTTITSSSTAAGTVMRCQSEFTVANATGTTLQLASPRGFRVAPVVVAAVGCLDGTIAIVSTGILAVNNNNAAAAESKPPQPSPAGTVLDTWASPGSATPLSLAWHPTQPETLAVGRHDGLVDIVSSHKQYQHRLLTLAAPDHHCPCRAVAYTSDGQWLVAGNDAGRVCVWEVNPHRRAAAPVLVHHVTQAHTSWILAVVPCPDQRRLITLGAERKLHVWDMGQMTQNQPLHTFQLEGGGDSTVWTASLLVSTTARHGVGAAATQPRLVTGSDSGWLQIFSLES